MKSEKVINEILYGDEGPYVSAIPVLLIATISDVFNKLILHLINKFDRCK